jgi:putative sigma-54 modulation protein
MKLIVNGRNIELTDAIKLYVEEKMGRLEQHYDFIQELHVFLSVEKNPRIAASQLAEVTVLVSRAVLRVTASSEDLYGSIDALLDKTERVLRKHKTKLLGRSKSGKGESIRRIVEGEPLEQDTLQAHDREDPFEEEGVYLSYTDSEDEEITAEGYIS